MTNKDEVLNAAIELSDLREMYCKNSPLCTECSTPQVQLIDYNKKNALWKCRHCDDHKFKTSPITPIELKSKKVYWNPNDKIIQRVLESDVDVLNINKNDLVHLIKELDRRLLQLWDKVSFERENELVDYSPIKRKLMIMSNCHICKDCKGAGEITRPEPITDYMPHFRAAQGKERCGTCKGIGHIV